MLKIVKYFAVIIIIGCISGSLLDSLHRYFDDQLLYRSPPVIVSMLYGMFITWLTYSTLLFLKMASYYYESVSTLIDGLLAVIITLFIFIALCGLSWGVDLSTVLLYLASISVGNFFIPYLDRFLTKLIINAR